MPTLANSITTANGLLPTEDGMLFTGSELIDPTGPTITVKALFVPGDSPVAPVAHNDASGALFVAHFLTTGPGTLSRIRDGALDTVAPLDTLVFGAGSGADFVVDRVSFLILDSGLPHRIAR